MARYIKYMVIGIGVFFLTSCSVTHKNDTQLQGYESQILDLNSYIKELEEQNESLVLERGELQEELDLSKEDILLLERSVFRLEHELDIEQKLDNPIDEFDAMYDYDYQGTLGIRTEAAIYRQLWEDELNHAYDELISIAHDDIKDELIQSRENYLEFSEHEFRVSMAAGASDGFGNEFNGELGDTINYGTIAPAVGSYTKAQLFKTRTYELHDYLKYLGRDIEFVFNADEVLKNNHFILVED